MLVHQHYIPYNQKKTMKDNNFKGRPHRNLWYFVCKYVLSLLPDTLFHNAVGYIMHKRHHATYHWMDIKHPKTFSEKLNYLKTHPVVANETDLADKYEVRDFVKQTIGEQYLVPILGVWSNADEVDFSRLPEQFVLKLTKGSGYNLICSQKSELNICETKKMLRDWLKINCYYFSCEPHYKGKSKLIAEQMLEYNITDYKFFCFNGIPKYVELYADRFGNHKKVFYDMNWHRAGFTTANDVTDAEIEKPAAFAEMKEVATKLCEGMKFVRVDLYVHNAKVYFGEMTFHPAGGYTPITPREWEYKLGDMIDL